jgi:hypothetical protein
MGLKILKLTGEFPPPTPIQPLIPVLLPIGKNAHKGLRISLFTERRGEISFLHQIRLHANATERAAC